MTIITSVPIIIAILTALEFIYIFILETIKTDSEKTAKTFGMEQSILKQENMNVSMKNQGVYNLGIAALLIASIFISKAMLASIFAYIVLVAAYGAATVDNSLIGILSKISGLLAENEIGIFAVSTYNTDYIFVKKENFDRTLNVLSEAGYNILK